MVQQIKISRQFTQRHKANGFSCFNQKMNDLISTTLILVSLVVSQVFVQTVIFYYSKRLRPLRSSCSLLKSQMAVQICTVSYVEYFAES